MKLLVTFLSLIFAAPALASSSPWRQAEGGRVRLVTVGLPDAQGVLKAVLDIQLDPGWKTYWREPGDAGVPPTLELAGGGHAELLYPTPEWHHDGNVYWAGYSASVALPVLLKLEPGAVAGPIEAVAFLGLCKTICIPLKADLVVDPQADPDSAVDSLALAAAEAQLPEPASATFGVTSLHVEGDVATFSVSGPAGMDAELFLAGSEGFAFSRPEPRLEDGKLTFRANVTSYLKAKPKAAQIFYTLKTPKTAVSGTLPF